MPGISQHRPGAVGMHRAIELVRTDENLTAGRSGDGRMFVQRVGA